MKYNYRYWAIGDGCAVQRWLKAWMGGGNKSLLPSPNENWSTWWKSSSAPPPVHLKNWRHESTNGAASSGVPSIAAHCKLCDRVAQSKEIGKKKVKRLGRRKIYVHRSPVILNDLLANRMHASRKHLRSVPLVSQCICTLLQMFANRKKKHFLIIWLWTKEASLIYCLTATTAL